MPAIRARGRPGELADAGVPARQRHAVDRRPSSPTPRATPAQGMNIGMVDSGTFAGPHPRARQPATTTTRSAIASSAVVAQGGNTGPTRASSTRRSTTRTARTSAGTIGGEPRRPRRAARGRRPRTCTASRSTSTSTSATRARPTACSTASWPANATAAQKPDNGYIGNVYRAVNAARRPQRQADPADHLELGQPAEHRELQHARHAAPAGPATSGSTPPCATCPRPRAWPTPTATRSHWLNGAIEVARAARSSSSPRATRLREPDAARPPRRTTARTSSRRWYTTSGINPGTGRTLNADGSVLVPGTQEFNQCGVAKWTCVTAPSRNINSTYCGDQTTACRSRPTRARRAPRWPARTRRPGWR